MERTTSSNGCRFWAPFSLHLLLLLLLLSGGGKTTMRVGCQAHTLGINYGQIANNLPNPSDVVPLVKSLGATHLKLYDANPKVLSAFANTGVSFTLGLGNEYLSQMRDPSWALSWAQRNLLAHLPNTTITSVAVGNEVLTLNDSSAAAAAANLLPAMQSLRSALTSLNLSSAVSVTTPHSLSVLQSSYPPSASSFRKDVLPSLLPILAFLDKTGAPFLINAYPFFAYKGSPGRVSLDFALFQPNQGVADPATGLRYDNMLFAQVDAVYSALAAAGYRRIPVQISETGWPSRGDPDETGATPDNARRYNSNLIRLLSRGGGTPMRPEADLSIYVFALFNENMKPGPTSERNYGLFRPDGSPAYDLGLGGNLSLATAPPAASENDTASSGPRAPESSSTGYLSISSSAPPKGGSGVIGHGLFGLVVLCVYWASTQNFGAGMQGSTFRITEF